MLRRCLPLLLIALLFLPARTGHAQWTYEYGLKGGVSWADIQTNTTGGGERRLGLVGGAFVEAAFSETVAAQVEVLYAQKGDEDDVNRGGERARTAIKLNYLEVPLLLKLQGPLLGEAEASVYGGPAFAFKLSESIRGLGPAAEVTGTLAQPLDVGVALGIEFAFELAEGTLLLDARFTPGLSELRDDAVLRVDGTAGEIPRPGASNSAFYLTVGLAF